MISRPAVRSGALAGGVLASALAFVMRPQLFAAHGAIPGTDAINLYAWEVYTRSALRAGRLPHWNPFHFAGTPHFADPQTTVLYPPAVLLRWLPVAPYLSWMAALHLWVGGMGAVFLARTIGLGWLAAMLAGVAMAMGGDMAPSLHNGHLLLVYNAAWLPWMLALAIRSVRRGGFLPHPLLPAIVALQFLAGYLQGALYSVALVAAYFVYCAIVPGRDSRAASRRHSLAQLALLGIVAAGLSAFQLFPAIRLISQAGRTGGLPYEVAAGGGWHFDDLARLFFPFRGLTGDEPYRALADNIAYVGWLLAAMVPFAAADRERRHIVVFLAIGATGALALACAASLPLYHLHFALLPGLRDPGRVLFIATLALAVLGAIGAECLVALIRQQRWGAAGSGMVVSLAAVGTAAAVTLGAHPAVAASHGWPWIPVFGVAAFAAVALAARSVGPRAALVLAVAALLVDLGVLASGAPRLVAVTPPADLPAIVGPADSGRIVSVCESQVNAADLLVARRPTVDGLAGIELRDVAAWAYVARFGDAPPDDGVFRRVSNGTSMPARRDLLDQANVSTVLSCAPLRNDVLVHAATRDGLARYRNVAVWPRAVWTCGAEEMTRADAITALRTSWFGPDGQLVPKVFINVRWAADLSAARRAEAERRYHLIEGARRDAATWRYVLADPSTPNGLALISDPAVADTTGLNRQSGAVVRRTAARQSPSAGGGYFVTGTMPCDTSARVTIVAHDQINGRTTVGVDAPRAGVLFISEAEYRERQAFLDGRRVMTMRTNLAFTGVAVPAGVHRVELRYVPEAFEYGAATSVATLLGWTWAVRGPGGRRRNMTAKANPESVRT